MLAAYPRLLRWKTWLNSLFLLPYSSCLFSPLVLPMTLCPGPKIKSLSPSLCCPEVGYKASGFPTLPVSPLNPVSRKILSCQSHGCSASSWHLLNFINIFSILIFLIFLTKHQNISEFFDSFSLFLTWLYCFSYLLIFLQATLGCARVLLLPLCSRQCSRNET